MLVMTWVYYIDLTKFNNLSLRYSSRDFQFKRVSGIRGG